MRFEDWLDAERGRLTKVAAHFQVSPSAVSQWRVNGVPVNNIVALHELTEKAVSLEELLDRSPMREPVAAPQHAAYSGNQRRGQQG